MFFIWLMLALAIYNTTAEIPKDLEVLIDLSDQVSNLRNSGPRMLVPDNLGKRSKGRMSTIALLLNLINCFSIDGLTAKDIKNNINLIQTNVVKAPQETLRNDPSNKTIKEIYLNVRDASKVPLAESHRNRPNDVLKVILERNRNSYSKYKELKSHPDFSHTAEALKDINYGSETDSRFNKRDILDIVTLPILKEVEKRKLKIYPLNTKNVDNKESLKDINLQGSRKNFDLIDFIKSRNVRNKAHTKNLTEIPEKIFRNKLGGFNNFASILLSGNDFDF
ncbi:unnamed protein product [Pieris macdunnoughi]|uniref:Uncharacterized protein n=1 Tax=Pieris macdunnoughi TaxID=345717 RepID=A0A821KXY4_9NEOP|nr:unnamed protein product [Pieris macdunnoughi]